MPDPNAGIIIAGAGQAGFQLAVSLRTEGYPGALTLIGDEPWLPYQRPPLSKAFMAGKQDIDATTLRPETFYADKQIDLLMGERIAAIDRPQSTVVLASGAAVPYQSLVLATGARNRQLRVPGADLDGVFYLRTRDEAEAIFARLESAQRVVVIGGGFIGLEFAAAAVAHGKDVLVVEAQTRLMARAVAPIMSEFFRDLHRANGVELALATGVREIAGDGRRVTGILLTDGDVYPADLIVVGIGVIPNTELAEAAGLAVANGIVVDDHLRTTDPNIYAIGDCCWHPNRFAGGAARLESVQNAVDQARSVAATLTGKPKPFDAVPWFWTDQFDAKLQMVGLSQDADQVIARGSIDSRKFSICYFKDDALIAIDSVNRPGDHLAGRKLLASGAVTLADIERALPPLPANPKS
jgi:3-phenylpropionate/trans-cinnamate dioxygenase ferredoxin reductase subunit